MPTLWTICIGGRQDASSIETVALDLCMNVRDGIRSVQQHTAKGNAVVAFSATEGVCYRYTSSSWKTFACFKWKVPSFVALSLNSADNFAVDGACIYLDKGN